MVTKYLSDGKKRGEGKPRWKELKFWKKKNKARLARFLRENTEKNDVCGMCAGEGGERGCRDEGNSCFWKKYSIYA